MNMLLETFYVTKLQVIILCLNCWQPRLVVKWFCVIRIHIISQLANYTLCHKHDWIVTNIAHDGIHIRLHRECAQGQGQGQRSRDTDTSVMSRSVCYTVPSDVLSLHALTLWSIVTLSFQYKCQAARCIVYIMEWATPSLTVWLLFLFAISNWVTDCTVCIISTVHGCSNKYILSYLILPSYVD